MLLDLRTLLLDSVENELIECSWSRSRTLLLNSVENESNRSVLDLIKHH